MGKIEFKSLSSGSCGNCYYLGMREDDGSRRAILIDAGVSFRALKKHLGTEGIPTESIVAILVTHDHMDHVRSLGSLCRHLNVPVYTTDTLRQALCRHPLSRDWFAQCGHSLDEGWNELEGAPFKVRWFEVPHDATQTVGYAIGIDGYRFVIMTDLGRMTEQAAAFATQADSIVIESNYDPHMLACGPYPLELQERIRNGHGHLSNPECAEAIRAFDHPGLRNVFLCHLSEHNNTPELAFSTSRPALSPEKRLVPLPRQTPSPLFLL